MSKEAMMNSRSDRHGSTRTMTCFFWVWLTMATAASVAGNVTHAIVNAPSGSAGLAAAAAVVPPVVLLGSTHSVALLMKARQTGRIHWCALLMTVALAGCAFVLSFDALSNLAVTAGMRADRAWLWPCAVDLSIAQSTLALLSLSGLPRDDPPRHAQARVIDDGPASIAAVSPSEGGVVPLASEASRSATEPSGAPDDSADSSSWRPTADQLIEAGVTQKDPAVVAQILAEHAAGMPPSTISRRLDVHHSTVGRILAHAESLG